MAQVTKSNGSFTTYSLRRIAGIKARRSSGFNACVGAALKGKTYIKPAPGMGGRNNKEVRNAFSSAAKACKG